MVIEDLSHYIEWCRVLLFPTIIFNIKWGQVLSGQYWVKVNGLWSNWTISGLSGRFWSPKRIKVLFINYKTRPSTFTLWINESWFHLIAHLSRMTVYFYPWPFALKKVLVAKGYSLMDGRSTLDLVHKIGLVSLNR